MSETVNQDAKAANAAAQTTPEQPAGKTFTQAELDAIVADRLARERAKYPDYESLKAKAAKFDAAEEAGKSELQKATDQAAALKSELDALKKENALREIRENVAKEKGVPASLLTGDSEEACKAQADAILAFAKPSGYPNLPDGGEVHAPKSTATRDQFAVWAASQI